MCMGVLKDIFGVYQNVTAMRAMNDLLIDHVKSLKNVDVIVGLDSRGFLLGPILSTELGKPFVPIRKKGKLPGNIKRESYTLEYGEATVEIQTDSISKGKKVLIVDDLLATGGTMSAAIKLIEAIGAEVVECIVLMELNSLNGRSKISVPVFSLIQYN
ncbi:adenine phosphoribosyltransferase-like [Microplitis demolitor]|uniref:adenine phosphoribosyltransferase-like n=1 Tax=Microplitis demolitor TaxID=69319 RepID=UPI00235B6F80|nr:adenine phosphoribosyltransferase-like [Microplitis demolitor]XP_053599206.1 adenine phosphoribosyltransferase-like [Microplitis demolitor]XP_053599220.1 adenine phosphoribosyltransferase-like [Microplitis demolitor]